MASNVTFHTLADALVRANAYGAQAESPAAAATAVQVTPQHLMQAPEHPVPRPAVRQSRPSVPTRSLQRDLAALAAIITAACAATLAVQAHAPRAHGAQGHATAAGAQPGTLAGAAPVANAERWRDANRG